MPTKRRPNLKRVLDSLSILCTLCGFPIPPVQLKRGAEGRVVGPKCGELFAPEEKR